MSLLSCLILLYVQFTISLFNFIFSISFPIITSEKNTTMLAGSEMKPGRRQFIQIFDNRTLQRCRQLSKQLICGQVKIVQFLRKGITKLDKETRQTILIIPFSFKIEIYCRYIVQKEHIYVSICIGHIWKSLSGSGMQGVGLARNCSVLVMGGSR